MVISAVRVKVSVGYFSCTRIISDSRHEADFIQGLLNKDEKKLVRPIHFMFRYIDDVLSVNNSKFGDFVDLIYPIELEIKDSTYIDRSASYIDIHFEIDTEGGLRRTL